MSRTPKARRLAIAALTGGMIVTDTGHQTFITEPVAEKIVDTVLDRLAADGYRLTKTPR